MSNGEPKWYMDAILGNVSEEGVYESKFAGIEGDTNEDINWMDAPSDSVLTFNPDCSIGFASIGPSIDTDVQSIIANGKDYLMIDNSGPEEMDPYKLQETIRELQLKLDVERDHTDAARTALLQVDPVAARKVKVESVANEVAKRTTAAEEMVNNISNVVEYHVGTSKTPVNSLEEAEKIVIDAGIPFGPYGGCCYSAREFSGYGISFSPDGKDLALQDANGTLHYGLAKPWDMSTVEMVSDPMPGCEVKLVSQEEVSYDNAMSMIGK